ncbi:MAG TPA: hypothetical protein VMB52_00400, partial [Verrucomicrobiae bacterium]|nr:hypothetical protein [Verrucomicrobiae bacterium]
EADTVHIAAGWEGSAGQMVQGWLPDTQVVKCWNSTGADNFYKPQFDAIPTMFIAGDNTDAKQQVGDLVRAFGWEPFDTGPIERSRECEALAVLWINNAMSNAGGHHAFKML